MADIWSEKNVGFIGPIKFLSDLTVGPTCFAKSDISLWKIMPYCAKNIHVKSVFWYYMSYTLFAHVFFVTRPFVWYHNFLTSWPRPWSLTYFWKTLTLAMTFLPEVILEVRYPGIWSRDINFWGTVLGIYLHFLRKIRFFNLMSRTY